MTTIKKVRQRRLDDNSYVKFGKFLLHYLELVDDPDELDWQSIIDRFTRINTKKKPGMMYINFVCAHEFQQDPLEIRNNKTRKRELVQPKHVAIYLANTLFHHLQEDISDYYHYKDRSAVPNANTAVEKLLSSDKYYKQIVNKITSILLDFKT